MIPLPDRGQTQDWWRNRKKSTLVQHTPLPTGRGPKAHKTFDSHMANSRQHSELVGDDHMLGNYVSGASFSLAQKSTVPSPPLHTSLGHDQA